MEVAKIVWLTSCNLGHERLFPAMKRRTSRGKLVLTPPGSLPPGVQRVPRSHFSSRLLPHEIEDILKRELPARYYAALYNVSREAIRLIWRKADKHVDNCIEREQVRDDQSGV